MIILFRECSTVNWIRHHKTINTSAEAFGGEVKNKGTYWQGVKKHNALATDDKIQ